MSRSELGSLQTPQKLPKTLEGGAYCFSKGSLGINGSFEPLAAVTHWGKKTVLTQFRVSFCCSTRWHNIEKARRVLGYEPQVGVEEGVRRMMEWWKTEVLDTKSQ
ncbi:hypothetical protein DL96DRAFT_1564910 [Flagelloscypha sp. PMI_526]|nr:hypothetical protein DL96DRAFT_1564910 [Flagelloscypha sp. PMI_526]